MDRNGDHMAVDPVSPAANYKEKECFDGQPIRPRRNSIEDRDSSRPRKRLATMGSTTPQSSSPATDKEDMDRSPRSTTLSPPSTTTAMTPNPAPPTADQTMDQTSDTPLPLHSSTAEELPVEGPRPSPLATQSEATVPVCPPRPLPQTVETSDDSPTHPGAPEPVIISVEPERESSLSPSEITSASASPWQDPSYLRSPEVEVEELDGMEEDEVLAESITVVGDDPERSLFDHKEILNQIAREFASGPNPRIQLNNVENYLARFLANSEEDQIKSLHAQSKTWNLIPDLLKQLLKRREVFSQEFVQGRNQYGRRILAKLLTRFLQLSMKLTELDRRMMQDMPTYAAISPFSDKFLAAAAEILIAHDELFIRLQKDYHIDLASDVAAALPELLETWGGFQAIKGYLQGIYIQLSEKPKLLANTIGPLSFIAEFLRSAFQRDLRHDMDQEKQQSFTAKLCEGAVEIVAMAEGRTRKILESNGQAVNIKDYALVVDILGNCVSYLSASIFNYGLQLLPQQFLENFHLLSPHERGGYSQALFKLPMFTTMIRCNRMDCRLLGISRFTDCLLSLWRSLGGDSNPSPALRCMADDIRRSGIIEYLVGPESHPELIRLSYNIGSFIVVNHCLTPDILQAVWQPLIDNKDPRIVQGVIKMVAEFISHMEYSNMVDLCTRAIDIPFSSYDTTMLDFVVHIINMTPRKYMDVSESHPCLDSAPYLLIIGLIRKAWVAEEEGQTCKGVSPSIISENLSHELINLTQYGPQPGMRKKIYLECIADIKNKNSSATGSIIVLWALLRGRPRTIGGESPDINLLTRELGCVDVLIDDIAVFVESHRNRDPSLRARKLKARLELLHWILLRSPGRMTPLQIEQVCEYLIGSKSLGHQERDMAFSNFALLINPNPFLDHFFQHVYPALNPLYLSLNCLEACKKWVEYANKGPPQVSSTKVVLLKGMEQVWKVILTVPEKHLYLEATNFLIRMYLESFPVTQNGPDVIYATHCSLVETCIQQLTSCAVELKALNDTNVSGQSMIVDVPETELGERQRKFERAIAVLNELLKGYRAKPRYPPGANTVNGQGGESRKILGAPVVITIRWYDQGSGMPEQNIHMGNLDSAEDLHRQITRVIGSDEYRAISGGQELYFRGELQRTLAELGFSGSAALMVQKRPTENGQAAEQESKGKLNSVEARILEHFDDLYEMLDSREHQGHLIHELLRQFPPQPRAKDILVSDDVPPEELLPLAAPYRCLYLLNAMRVWVDDAAQTEVSNYANRMVNGLVCFLMKQDLAVNDLIELRFQVLNEALSVLDKFLNTTLENNESFGNCFKDETKFASRIVHIWDCCLQPQYSRFEVSANLAVNAFLLMIEAARLRKGIWTAYTTSKECTRATERMLLHDPRDIVRKSIMSIMARTCSNTTSYGDVPCIDIARFFWSMLVDILPQAFNYEGQCEQLFEVARYFLEYPGKNSGADSLALNNKYFLDWTNVLMTRQVKQVIGRPSEDNIVIGYTILLCSCKRYLRGRLECSDLPSRIIGIFCNLLFTPLTQLSTEDEIPEETLPCMGPVTRDKLYYLLLLLADDESVNSTIIGLLSELISQEQTAILPETMWNFDRTQLPISGAGRVGLRNLSNTCYLNSLITQLFMNIPFRSFIFNMNVDDPEDSQNLLHSIKSLFAKMQNGLVKTADTRELAQAIKDYENNEIDVTVQMDVDEFFNLLFDRIEGQLESVEQKNMFRSFYGGKLVQQVKSKECPHISEREEPFSAIQCDIKGKAGLQESLKAYVEGEIMEGDNKYSCTSCNKHVDAVKRACLKEIPDHLIFHLKRFEFDLHTMVRSKINDSFEFPECIDMRPYTIQYLSDSDPCTTPDVFQLAGVLVHNGTAESGHYYSYIKDRHEVNEHNNPIWFEFNDAEVSSFDPSVISMQCYGGTDFIGPSKELGQPIAFQKSYSAYMLFYERIKPLQTQEEKLNALKKIPITRDLAIEILQDNERSVRKYCLFDASFLSFTTKILRQSHTLRLDKSTPETELIEQQALQLALRTFEQIASRIKDCREADELFITIRELIQARASIACARGFLRWICDNKDSYRLLLLRCPHQRIRENFASLVLAALIHIRRRDHVTEDEDITTFPEYRRIFEEVLRTTLGLWDFLNIYLKPWDEFFLLLAGIAKFGRKEKEILLRTQVLKRCFWLFFPEYLDRELRAMHLNVIKVFEKNPKRISCRMLLEFMEHLLEPINIGLNPCKSENSRTLVPEYDAYPLTHEERDLLLHTIEKDRTMVNAFFFKQVFNNFNGAATLSMIRNFLTLDQEPSVLFGLIEPMKSALMNGIVLDPANEAAPYLEALVQYCSYIKYPAHVKEIISRVAEEVGTIGMNGGAEHFRFFYHLFTLRNPKLKPPVYATNRVIEAVPQWAPPLLCFPEAEVRENTELLLKEKLFQPRFEGNTSEGRKRIIENAIERLPEACFRFAEDKFLKIKDLCAAADEKTFDSLIRILELCPRNDVEEDPGYSSRIDALRNLLIRHVEELELGSENWAASDVGSDSNHELGDDDSV